MTQALEIFRTASFNYSIPMTRQTVYIVLVDGKVFGVFSTREIAESQAFRRITKSDLIRTTILDYAVDEFVAHG